MGFLFGSQPKAATPTRMPAANDAVVKAAQQRQRRAIGERSGRTSTILTERGQGSGTQSYTNSLLGQAG